MSYFVYIVECNDGTLYTGFAKDVQARLAKHNAGKGAKYIRGKRIPAKLVGVWEYPSVSFAMRAEYLIKKLSRQDKKIMIASYQKRDLIKKLQ